MSNAHIPSGYLKSVLHNGVGRYVCQLQRLTIKFCKSWSGSRGVRDFIETDLLEFTRMNPGIVVYLKPRRHRTPRLVAEYLNGRKEELIINEYNREEICQWVEHLRTRSGHEIVRLEKWWHTDHPSVQGIWTPFTNKDSKLNVADFPCKELSEFDNGETSATGRLLELAKELRAKNLVEIEEDRQAIQTAKSS